MVIDFGKIAAFVPEGGSLAIGITTSGSDLVVSVTPRHPEKVGKSAETVQEKGFQPMVFHGAPEELGRLFDEVRDVLNLQKAYLDMSKSLSPVKSSTDRNRADLKKATEDASKKAPKGNAKALPAPKQGTVSAPATPAEAGLPLFAADKPSGEAKEPASAADGGAQDTEAPWDSGTGEDPEQELETAAATEAGQTA